VLRRRAVEVHPARFPPVAGARDIAEVDNHRTDAVVRELRNTRRSFLRLPVFECLSERVLVN
jgi:hypothetical protein